MNATDYRQIHAAIMRCCAELRGIAARLRHRREVQRQPVAVRKNAATDSAAAAALIDKMADMLHGLIASLQPFRVFRDEASECK